MIFNIRPNRYHIDAIVIEFKQYGLEKQYFTMCHIDYSGVYIMDDKSLNPIGCKVIGVDDV